MQLCGLLKCVLLAFYLVLAANFAKGQGCGQTLYPSTIYCPQGYIAFNGLCYLPNQLPKCETTTTTTTSNPHTTPTPTTPTPPSLTICPKDSIFEADKCRKIICPNGEFIGGRCRKAICPENTVWRGHSCQERGFITTIIEIDNVFKTKTHENHGNTTHTNENNTKYINTNNTMTAGKPTCRPRPTMPPLPTRSPPLPGCCIIYLPRTCRIFKEKWVCYNPQRKVCHVEMCLTPTIYIRTPQIVEDPNFVVIPPYPPLADCPQHGCGAIADFDCSGCARGLRQFCSPYCYYYNCPRDGCTYVDWHQYCGIYPNGYGCTPHQGCKWDWCG